MKKILVCVTVLLAVCGLVSGCEMLESITSQVMQAAPAQAVATTQVPVAEATEPPTTEPPTTVPPTTAPPLLTFGEFLAQTDGFWLAESTVKWDYDMYSGTYAVFRENSCGFNWFPYGEGMPGVITDYEALSENQFRLEIKTGGYYEGIPVPDSYNTMLVTFLGNGKIEAHYGDEQGYIYTYAGSEYADLQKAAARVGR